MDVGAIGNRQAAITNSLLTADIRLVLGRSSLPCTMILPEVVFRLAHWQDALSVKLPLCEPFLTSEEV